MSPIKANKASTSSFPAAISLSTMFLPKFVMMSKQFIVISWSIISTNIEMRMSTSLKHLITWCSLALMKEKLRIINMMLFRWFISSSSLTSQLSTVISFLRFLRSSSNAFCSSSILDLVFLPLARLTGSSWLSVSSF